eukprot:14392806-Ditylum_brightwellii.AAC.1
MSKTATTEELGKTSRTQTLVMMQINMLHTQLEQVEWKPQQAMPLDSIKKGVYPSKTRAPSPPAESHKK